MNLIIDMFAYNRRESLHKCTGVHAAVLSTEGSVCILNWGKSEACMGEIIRYFLLCCSQLVCFKIWQIDLLILIEMFYYFQCMKIRLILLLVVITG